MFPTHTGKSGEEYLSSPENEDSSSNSSKSSVSADSRSPLPTFVKIESNPSVSEITTGNSEHHTQSLEAIAISSFGSLAGGFWSSESADTRQVEMNGSDEGTESDVRVKTTMIETDNFAEGEDGDPAASHIWVKAEVDALLTLYKERESDLKDPRRKKKTIWNEISSEMRKRGFSVTSIQCECKMKNMKASYRRALDRNAHTGEDQSLKCPFFAELYQIFGPSPPVRPSPIGTTMRTEKRRATLEFHHFAESDSASNGNIEGIQTADEPLAKRPALENLKFPKDFVDEAEHQNIYKVFSELFEELRAERKAHEHERKLREDERRRNEEERDKRAREFHEERMAMLNAMNKLISSIGSGQHK